MYRAARFSAASILSLLCLTRFLPAQARAQSVVQGPMAQVARDYAWRPVRADVVPQTQGVKAGEPVRVKVMLLDASGKLTNAIEKTAFVIQAVEPSGKTSETKVNVEPGASSVEAVLPGWSPG